MTWELLVAIGGGIVLAANVGTVIYKCIKPALNMHSDVNELKHQVSELQKHDQNDFAVIRKVQEMNKEQCKAMVVLINHMVDGNNIEDMKKTRETILTILAEH